MVPANINDRVPFSTGDDVASWLAGGGSGGGPRPSLSAPRLLAVLGLGGAAAASRGGGMDLTAAAQGAMSDSEEAAAQRRLLASVLSLQPFLRDTRAPADAAAAAPMEPLEGPQLESERQSVAALLAQCDELLARAPTTLQHDEALLSGQQGDAAALAPRHAAAVAARLESKRLVAAAADALQRYADTLR